jgi:hypothetical protein
VENEAGPISVARCAGQAEGIGQLRQQGKLARFDQLIEKASVALDGGGHPRAGLCARTCTQRGNVCPCHAGYRRAAAEADGEVIVVRAEVHQFTVVQQR